MQGLDVLLRKIKNRKASGHNDIPPEDKGIQRYTTPIP